MLQPFTTLTNVLQDVQAPKAFQCFFIHGGGCTSSVFLRVVMDIVPRSRGAAKLWNLAALRQ